ncbi:response regulator [Bacteriovorax sp. Seq25_V]|uniref:response regulator n=1 Tax=Bacteriovorax sp. Seq25_V TaxID=1201288 RepID=UPI0018DF0077|nr:response regulator [Bacteriovorax sp. Seq25_V]
MKNKILIIDDEPDILELLAEELEYEGFATACAGSGNDAVRILENENFDLVISDYKMPNGNGKVVLDYVKSIPESRRPVFFFVSGQADMSFEEALNEGVRKFFYKPFDLEELIVAIKEEIVKS